MKTLLAILAIALLTTPAFAGRGDLAVKSRKAVGPRLIVERAVVSRKAVGPEMEVGVAIKSRKAIGPRVQRKDNKKAKLDRLDTGERVLDLNAGL